MKMVSAYWLVPSWLRFQAHIACVWLISSSTPCPKDGSLRGHGNPTR